MQEPLVQRAAAHINSYAWITSISGSAPYRHVVRGLFGIGVSELAGGLSILRCSALDVGLLVQPTDELRLIVGVQRVRLVSIIDG